MGFNPRKMDDERRLEAEKQAAAKRADRGFQVSAAHRDVAAPVRYVTL
jgi:hypothetical protein